MRARAILLGFLSICCLLVLAATTEDSSPLGGYSATTSKTEREWETKFRAIPSPQNLRDYMQRLAAHPHHVGSPYDKDNAEWMQAKFKEWGLDAHIESFDVLFPTPKTRLLEMVEPTNSWPSCRSPRSLSIHFEPDVGTAAYLQRLFRSMEMLPGHWFT